MEEVLLDFGCGALHPADLKPALAKAINKILQVSRLTSTYCVLFQGVMHSHFFLWAKHDCLFHFFLDMLIFSKAIIFHNIMTLSISIFQPVRDHFNNNSEAKALLETVKVNDCLMFICIFIFQYSFGRVFSHARHN